MANKHTLLLASQAVPPPPIPEHYLGPLCTKPRSATTLTWKIRKTTVLIALLINNHYVFDIYILTKTKAESVFEGGEKCQKKDYIYKNIFQLRPNLSEGLFTGIPSGVKGVTCPPKILNKCVFTRNPEKTLITFEGLCLSPQKNSCKRL